MVSSKEKIFLIGESPLIEEFGECFFDKKFEVYCKFNERVGKAPGYLKKTVSVPRGASLGVELTNIDIVAKKKNLVLLDKNLPSSKLILSSSVTVSAIEQASWLRHPERLIGVCALPSLIGQKLIEFAPTVYSGKEFITRARDIALQLQKEFCIVQDRVGMVLPRILCMLINEASFALLEGTASPNDIDTAMKLGTNYPFGPVEWAEKIGIRQVAAVLEAIHVETGEERYRVSPLLRQLATGRTWWRP